MSATIPAPPDGSRPAIVNTTGRALGFEFISDSLDNLRQALRVTQQSYRSNTARTRRETFPNVLNSDSADRNDRKAAQFFRYLAELFQSLRWSKGTLRFSFKHW